MLIAFYFMNTSLSTVGLGDFKPISDAERLTCTFMLIAGVGLFSYFVGQVVGRMALLDDYYKDEIFKEGSDL